MAEIAPQTPGAATLRRAYVPPALERHEDWEVVTGQPISPQP